MDNGGLSALLGSAGAGADLSSELLSAIFGSGWSDIGTLLAGNADGVMGTLIFSLLNVLNCCGAFAVAWMFLLTTLAATVGTAQDGTGTGGRKYGSVWIPLRYSFAIAAVTPVSHGLNAMQMLVLAATGTSVGLANQMWEAGLEHVGTTGSVAAVASPAVENTGKQVIAGLLRHASLRIVLEKENGCTFSNSPRDAVSGASGDEWQEIFELPYPTQCTSLGEATSLPSSNPGDCGTVVVSTKSKAASERIASFIKAQLYPRVLELAQKNGMKGASQGALSELELRSLLRAYANAASSELSAAAIKEHGKEAAIKEFSEHASSAGWVMAGSCYWSLAKVAAQSVSLQRDDTKVQDPRLEAFRGFASAQSESMLKNGWEMASFAAQIPLDNAKATNPASGKELFAGGAAPESQSTGFWGTVAGFFGNAASAIQEFRISDAKGAGSASLSMLGENDIVFNVVRASRNVMNACEDAFAAYAVIRTASKAAEALANWVPFLGEKLGKTAALAGDTVNFAAAVAMVIAAPIWAVCWFYAYMLPAVPFVAWFTAVIGWLTLTLEAVAACPVWLVSHCMPEGDGFAGASGRAGYALFASVVLRPPLLVLAFFICMIVMSVSGTLLGRLLIPFFSSSSGAFYESATGFGSGFGVTEAVSAVVLTGALVGVATWKLFTLVTLMPDRLLRWGGQLLHSLGDDNAHMQVREAAQSMQAAGGNMPATVVGATGAVAAGSRIAREHLPQGEGTEDDSGTRSRFGQGSVDSRRVASPFAAYRRMQSGDDDVFERRPFPAQGNKTAATILNPASRRAAGNGSPNAEGPMSARTNSAGSRSAGSASAYAPETRKGPASFAEPGPYDAYDNYGAYMEEEAALLEEGYEGAPARTPGAEGATSTHSFAQGSVRGAKATTEQGQSAPLASGGVAQAQGNILGKQGSMIREDVDGQQGSDGASGLQQGSKNSRQGRS